MLSDPFTILIIVIAAIPGCLYLFSPAYRRKAKSMDAAWANSIAKSLHWYAERFQRRGGSQQDPEVEHLRERIENLEAIVSWEAWSECTRIDRDEGDISLLEEGATLERTGEETLREMARDRRQGTAETPDRTSGEKV